MNIKQNLSDPIFSDYDIICLDKTIKAHRIILAQNKYFYKLMTFSDINKFSVSFDESHDIVFPVISCIYNQTPKISSDISIFIRILMFADRIGMAGLNGYLNFLINAFPISSDKYKIKLYHSILKSDLPPDIRIVFLIKLIDIISNDKPKDYSMSILLDNQRIKDHLNDFILPINRSLDDTLTHHQGLGFINNIMKYYISSSEQQYSLDDRNWLFLGNAIWYFNGNMLFSNKPFDMLNISEKIVIFSTDMYEYKMKYEYKNSSLSQSYLYIDKILDKNPIDILKYEIPTNEEEKKKILKTLKYATMNFDLQTEKIRMKSIGISDSGLVMLNGIDYDQKCDDVIMF